MTTPWVRLAAYASEALKFGTVPYFLCGFVASLAAGAYVSMLYNLSYKKTANRIIALMALGSGIINGPYTAALSAIFIISDRYGWGPASLAR